MPSNLRSLPSYLHEPANRYRLEQARQKTNNAAAIADPVDWLEAHFYIPETADHRLRLEPYQRAVLREAYRKDDAGDYVYSIIVWSDIKKSIKSTIAGGVCLHRAATTPWGSVKIVANDLKQADSREAYYIRRALELNGEWTARHVTSVKPSGYLIELANRARIEAIPVDPKGEAGGNDHFICFSELWAANQKAALRMWTEMTLSPTLFGKSQRWVETYAGFSGESPLLEQLYQTGVKEGRLLDLGIDGLEVYANDAARMLCLWNTQPRCPWQTDAYYAQEAAILTPSEFERVHRNQWASSESAFLEDISWWDGCLGTLAPLRPAQGVVVGLDAAVSGDCFAVVGVSRTGDLIEKRFARKWTPPHHGAIDFADVESYLRDVKARYNVVEWAYDPYQLHDMAQRLGRAGLGWFRPFSQGTDRLVADKHLYDIIRGRRLIHDGDPDLREHIQNANRKDDGDKLRLVKRAEHLKIDLAVALSQAAYEAKRLNIG